MAEILWGPHQVQHIEREHHVTREQFDQAWHDPHRQDVEERPDGSVLSLGFTHEDELLEMVWRLDDDPDQVFPITAYLPDEVNDDDT